MMNRRVDRAWAGIVMILMIMTLLSSSCSSTKHVPQGKMLLDNVKINIADPHPEVKSSQLSLSLIHI